MGDEVGHGTFRLHVHHYPYVAEGVRDVYKHYRFVGLLAKHGSQVYSYCGLAYAAFGAKYNYDLAQDHSIVLRLVSLDKGIGLGYSACHSSQQYLHSLSIGGQELLKVLL